MHRKGQPTQSPSPAFSQIKTRFEGDFAVLLVGDDQTTFPIERTSLPSGIREGDWLNVSIENSVLTQTVLDPQSTTKMAETIAEKMARLRKGDHLK